MDIEKTQVIYKGATIRKTTYIFQHQQMIPKESGKYYQDVVKSKYQARIVYLIKLSFKKMCGNKQNFTFTKFHN